MKILICTNHSYMYYQFRKELTEKLLEEHEVLLSTPYVGREQELRSMGCKLIKTPVDRRSMNPFKDYKLIQFYEKLIKKENPDLVITYSIKPNLYAGRICQKLHIPYCVNVQGLGSAFEKPGISQLVTHLYKSSLRSAKITFFENSADAKFFRDQHIQTEERQCILPGAGVNMNKYAYLPYPDNNVFHFLYLGRIMKEKGMDELLEAIHRLQQDSIPFHIDFLGFYEDDYKERIYNLLNSGIASFYEFCDDPIPFYQKADCIVLPSYHEGMSNVLLESSSLGRPVITSNISGCKEAVIDGKSGYLIQVKDSNSLYQSMKKMLSLTKIEREQMGIAGREHMKAIFDKQVVVEKTIKELFR